MTGKTIDSQQTTKGNLVGGVVGFLSSAPNRRSNSRLTVFICAIICLGAAFSEGYAKAVNGVSADWSAVGVLVGVLLLGNAALKAAQRINSNPNQGGSDGTDVG